MKQYPAYKDSGVEWIGKIPNHWTISRIKNAIAYSINGVWGDDPNENGENMLCIRVADFDMKSLGVSQNNLTYRCIPVRFDDQRILKKGSLLIEKSGGGEKQPVGRVISFNLNEKAVSSNFIAKISPNRDLVDSGFLLYFFNVLYSFGINNLSIKQTTGIQNLDTTHYFNNQFCFPSLPEQVQITNFLEHKTHQIDDLIAKKQKLLELLHEERTALINQVVTKGLDPAVPLRDSGIEWLGEIPEHWMVKRLKFLVDNIIEKSSTSNFKVALENIESWTGRYLKTESPSELTGEMKSFKPNDVLFNKLRPYLAKVYLSEVEGECVGELLVLRPQAFINPKFIYYRLLSRDFIEVVNSSTYGAKMPRASWEDFIRNLIIPYPEIMEQELIVEEIEKITMSISNAIVKLEDEIELIAEYKTSLINEAVTGKIDVRNFVTI